MTALLFCHRDLATTRGWTLDCKASDILAKVKRARPRRPKFAAIREFIDKILKEDEQAPSKQRRTAHRSYERLGVELANIELTIAVFPTNL